MRSERVSGDVVVLIEDESKYTSTRSKGDVFGESAESRDRVGAMPTEAKGVDAGSDVPMSPSRLQLLVRFQALQCRPLMSMDAALVFQPYTQTSQLV